MIHYVDYDGEAVFGGDIVLHVERGYAAFQRGHLHKAFGTKSAYTASDGPDLGDYDFASIMHYGCTAASKNGSMTIIPEDWVLLPLCGGLIGQRRLFIDLKIENSDRSIAGFFKTSVDSSSTRDSYEA